MKLDQFDEYTAEQLQEAHDWWTDHDVTLPNPYHQPMLYLSYMTMYYKLVKPGLQEEDDGTGDVSNREEDDRSGTDESSSKGS